MPLVNVRLDDDDARKAGALRKAGIPVSSVLREAIRTEYARRIEGPNARLKPSELVAEIIARFPDAGRRTEVDATDRRAVRRHIRRALRRRR
ncbi:MAG: hypothetical protein HYY18_00815 [Planctomycetes bacterium]|nr:hypothetical protein [Planctomycetota bacterium]